MTTMYYFTFLTSIKSITLKLLNYCAGIAMASASECMTYQPLITAWKVF